MPFCPACGTEREETAQFCVRCGRAFDVSSPTKVPLDLSRIGLTPGVFAAGFGAVLMVIGAFLPWFRTAMVSMVGTDFLGIPLLAGLLSLGGSVFIALGNQNRNVLLGTAILNALAATITLLLIIGLLALRAQKLAEGGLAMWDAPNLQGGILLYCVGAAAATVGVFGITKNSLFVLASVKRENLPMFGRRASAAVLDGVILLALTSVLSQHFLIGQIVNAIYYIVFWVLKGATPGKMIMGLRIVELHGSHGVGLSPSVAVKRYLGIFLSGIALGLGFLWMLRDNQLQCWHDKLAGTLVVRTTEPTGSIEEEIDKLSIS